MKIVQSFWSKPLFDGNRSDDHRRCGGWNSMNGLVYATALSCLLLKRQYKNVSLVTDSFGKKLLIDLIKLPYTEVTVVLDSINHYPADFWALGKMMAYSIQKHPFIHVDNDVFVFDSFSTNIHQAQLLAQSVDYDKDYYREILKEIHGLIELPDFASSVNLSSPSPIIASNAGIIGGNQVDFFSKLADHAFGFVSTNLAALSRLNNPSLINLIFEQFFFHRLAQELGIEVAYAMNSVSDRMLVQFHLAPHRQKYFHVVGKTQKKDRLINEKIRSLLRSEFSEYFFTIYSLNEKSLI